MTKIKLLEHCKSLVEQNIQELKDTIKDYQSAANNETKSTAGDKHDVARSMAQIEVEKLSRQLALGMQDLANLNNINTKIVYTKINTGALVTTSKLKMFLSIGLGRIEMDGEDYFCLSESAPIALKIMGKMKGDSYEMNGVVNEIIKVE